jgi:hypothetical protein
VCDRVRFEERVCEVEEVANPGIPDLARVNQRAQLRITQQAKLASERE